LVQSPIRAITNASYPSKPRGVDMNSAGSALLIATLVAAAAFAAAAGASAQGLEQGSAVLLADRCAAAPSLPPGFESVRQGACRP
jgi:hypothetical protein